jgi:small-conductance mechanosensitive channel
MTNTLSNYLAALSAVEIGLLISCFLLIVFSRKIFSTIFHLVVENNQHANKLKIFRACALLIIAIVLLNHFIFIGEDSSLAKKLLGLIMVVFCAFWASQILQYFIRKHYGHTREVAGEKVVSDSYNSRLLSVLVAVLVFVFALIGIVEVLGFNNLLEAGGIIGFMGVMLALTQGAWAPDIISGLIILNSDLLEEGDVIEMNDGKLLAQVFRTKLFHTELLDLVNNHRVLVKNAKLRDTMVHNLSKFASAKGFRENLLFNISYDIEPQAVRKMFLQAYGLALNDSAIAIEANHDLEIRVCDTADYAVQWGIYYYTKDIKRIIKTRQLFRELILTESLACKISLSTPLLYHREQEKTDRAALN